MSRIPGPALVALLLVTVGVAAALLLCLGRTKPREISSEPLIPAYVIHLKERTDRAANIERLRRLARRDGFELRTLDAVRGAQEERVRPFVDMTHRPHAARDTLRKGEVGCFASHALAWRALSETGGVVIEDDSVVEDEGFRRLRRAIDESEGEASRVIMGRYSRPRGSDGACENERLSGELVRVRCPCYNTNLYFVSAEAATRLLAHDAQDRMPSDDFLSSAAGVHPTARRKGVTMLAMEPRILTPMRSRSDTA